MKPINLFTLSRVGDIDTFYIFEKLLSDRENSLPSRLYEKNSLDEFVNILLRFDEALDCLENFYYSFEIAQIGKEFDLLRINDDKVINIELKSQSVDKDKMLLQLIRNKYYLSHLSRELHLYTFVAGTGELYRLDENCLLVQEDFKNLHKLLIGQKHCFCDDIECLFKVSDFLVSPLNTPERFMDNNYFLTSQQEYFKKVILNNISKYNFFGIEGAPGTGKTLLLYDLAKEISSYQRSCLIHCGVLSEGHKYLNIKMRNLDIIPIKSINTEFDFSKYQFLFIDESQRLYKKQFTNIVEAKKYGVKTIFSFDSRQVLSRKEVFADIVNCIKSLPNYKGHNLSNKIRINKELASFIKCLMNLNSNDKRDRYQSVSLAYANNNEEAYSLIDKFRKNGYVFINYTGSLYNYGPFDCFGGDINTHYVVGQEFDKVLMLLDGTFKYDSDDKLVAKKHPNPDYLYLRLLFQGLTRVREKLGIIVINDLELFKRILSILQV